MNVNRFAEWLQMQGPVALTVVEELEPVQGTGSVFFPPTFAPPEGSKESPGYVIDETAGGKVAMVDTVGSQANRMEPIFKEPPHAALVPKATVKVSADRKIDALDAGHRAADAVVRFSEKWGDLRKAFLAIRERRDAAPLAKLSPTSLVFGVWDSRDTQVKLPRIVGSTIRAYGVDKLKRSAQFFAATEKVETEGLASQEFLSAVGLDDAPAGRTNGGIIARHGIKRETVLNLVALRALSASDADATLKLQRYILGLSLVALLAPPTRFLREGCLLVPIEGKEPEVKLVERTGKRSDFKVSEAEALEFAQAAADDFGVGDAWTATFSPDAVKQAAEKKEQDKARKKEARKK
jgi:CRISPR-associated protein Csb1